MNCGDHVNVWEHFVENVFMVGPKPLRLNCEASFALLILMDSKCCGLYFPKNAYQLTYYDFPRSNTSLSNNLRDYMNKK